MTSEGDPAEPTAFIGPNDVAVPTHFYKVILCRHSTGSIELFAFLLENGSNPLAGRPRDYLESVDVIEWLSGLDFFSALPDSEEERLETTVATNWPID